MVLSEFKLNSFNQKKLNLVLLNFNLKPYSTNEYNRSLHSLVGKDRKIVSINNLERVQIGDFYRAMTKVFHINGNKTIGVVPSLYEPWGLVGIEQIRS